MKQFVISRIDWFGDIRYLATMSKENKLKWTLDPHHALKLASITSATEVAKSTGRPVTINSMNVEIEPIVRVRS